MIHTVTLDLAYVDLRLVSASVRAACDAVRMGPGRAITRF